MYRPLMIAASIIFGGAAYLLKIIWISASAITRFLISTPLAAALCVGGIGGIIGGMLVQPSRTQINTIDPYTGLRSDTYVVPERTTVYTPDISGQTITVLEPVQMFFVRAASSDDPPVLWSIPENLSPKEQLKIIGKKFYDFANGTSYVRVHRVNDNKIGFIKLNDFVSRTGISDAKVTTASINGHNIPIALSHVPGRFSSMVKGKSFAETLNAGLSEYVHPAHAAVVAFDGVFSAFHLNSTADAKEAERFFREYVTPEAVQFGPDAIAWPYKFKFTIAWMGEIEAPWYSAYANSVMALNAALMFNMTGESHYRDIARKAINWIRIPVTAGGGLYTIDGFDFVAEYAYPSPPHGNIRVLDGEMISLLSIYSVAVILEDEDMLRFAIRLIYGLSTQLELFTTSNDLIQNARFQWLVDNPGYVIAMKQWATMLHWISKEKAFKRASERWHKSPHYWPAKSYPPNNL